MINPTGPFFVDTSFWIALLEAGDVYHVRSIAWQQHIVPNRIPLTTTEAVLWEMLSYFAAPATRQRAASLYRATNQSNDVRVVGTTDALRDAAVA